MRNSPRFDFRARTGVLRTVALIVLVCAVPSCISASEPKRVPSIDLENQTYKSINAHRRAEGLAPLHYDARIAAVARRHSEAMAAGKVAMGHEGFEARGRRIAETIPLQGMAENVGFNAYPLDKTVGVAVSLWLASPGHRANIEDDYDVTGIGIARGRQGDRYYTQIFVKRGRSRARNRRPAPPEEGPVNGDPTRTRCAWAGTDPLYVAYHDLEWGVPVHNDRLLFEFLTLEGAQAGLSWLTILRKREAYRMAFAGFDPEAVAQFGKAKVAKLLADPGIVRNRLKVESALTNTRAFLRIQEEFGSFDAYQWRFVGGRPIRNTWNRIQEIPASTPASDAMSSDLKKRGFRFVGSTIIYAHMQAVGMVNDHVVSCFRWQELAGKHL